MRFDFTIYICSFCTLLWAFQSQDAGEVAFPWTAMSDMQWEINPQGFETNDSFAFGSDISSKWEKSAVEAITRAELQLLHLYEIDPSIGIAEQIFVQCQTVKSLSDELARGLQGDEWEPVRHHLDMIIQKALRNLKAEFDVDVISTNTRTAAAKFVQNFRKLTATLQEVSFLVDNRFAPVTANYTPDLQELAHSLDELDVGRIIAEGIAHKIEQMVVGGDLHAAITEIANIFGDLGVLLTAYATGLAICTANVVIVLCGVSILVCGGGTVIFICRLLQHLNNIYKVLGG
ncbi:LAFA_0C03136g1_1 [Lachancea sp. 'fantastica']|nr:LAFA_0C03136g1_1 [Lachancea sp. 'fantastica']